MLRMLAGVTFAGLLCFGAAGVFAQASAADYPEERHYVTTDDGYILQLRRIPYGLNQTQGPREVVFLMHGFLAGSTAFTYLDPEYAIAYTLADAGYDVWMGNARGNIFSRRHVSLNPDINKIRFFNFTYEEIGLRDMPVMIDHVLNKTMQTKLHYIGHSQGGTVFYVLTSLRPEYQAKIASANLLAPFGYTNAFPDKALEGIANNTETIYATLLLAGIVEINLPLPGLLIPALSILDKIVDLVYDLPFELFAGASVKQAAHLGQNIKYKSFRRYNFGSAGNLKAYGSDIPPAYDLSVINTNITVHYSLSDKRVSETDALAMARDLPNARARKVPDDSFAHNDYITNKSVKELVINYILESLSYSKIIV